MCEEQQVGVFEVCDVVVVGGGLSGLCSARRLKERNEKLRVLVLEAKGRVGGRTLTLSLPASDGMDYWDMGGQWVGSSQTDVMGLIQDLGLEVYTQFTEGKKVHHRGGANAEISTYTSSIPSFPLLVLLDFMHFLWRTPDALQLDSMTLKSYMEKHIWTTQLTEELELCTRSVFGMETSQLSFLYFLMYSAAAGGVMRLLETTPGSAQEFKVKGGTQQLSKRIAQQLGEENVRLGSAVTAIWQNKQATPLILRKSKQATSLLLRKNKTGHASFTEEKKIQTTPLLLRKNKQATPLLLKKNKQATPLILRKSKQATPLLLKKNKQATPSYLRKSKQATPLLLKKNKQATPLILRKSKQATPLLLKKNKQATPPSLKKNKQATPLILRKSKQATPLLPRKDKQATPPSLKKNKQAMPPLLLLN
ncbi:Amine oxidase [flavin-containing] A [Bagarius yarrelli]|uniref:Amine oxidase n=1 Tax=Bagarius yarrelli TaxID=175774 RepID=A0A556V9Q3_BAGYA|nr:Amine oxidase [flavin-containing] A [Bagarius yarrelli]